MPKRFELTDEIIQDARCVFRSTYYEYKRHANPMVLILLIVQFYETSILITSFQAQNNLVRTANDKYLREVLPVQDNVHALCMLRDILTHKFYMLARERNLIALYIKQFGKQNTNFLAVLCLGIEVDLFQEILDGCMNSVLQQIDAF